MEELFQSADKVIEGIPLVRVLLPAVAHNVVQLSFTMSWLFWFLAQVADEMDKVLPCHSRIGRAAQSNNFPE